MPALIPQNIHTGMPRQVAWVEVWHRETSKSRWDFQGSNIAPATRDQNDQRRISAARASETPDFDKVVRDGAFSARAAFQPVPRSLTHRPCRVPSKMGARVVAPEKGKRGKLRTWNWWIQNYVWNHFSPFNENNKTIFVLLQWSWKVIQSLASPNRVVVFKNWRWT